MKPAAQPNYRDLAAALAGAVLIAVTLSAWGQPLICTCGEVRLWVGSVFDSGNSQHIADWYTLSHIIHGMLVVAVGRLVAPRAPFAVLLAVAIVTGVAWELLEHTDWVLSTFRATTIYQGYVGDSVLNAVADYLWMLGGLLFANALRTAHVIVAVAAIEIGSAAIARDSLTLATLMVIYPIDSIETWQQEINPNGPAQQAEPSALSAPAAHLPTSFPRSRESHEISTRTSLSGG